MQVSASLLNSKKSFGLSHFKIMNIVKTLNSTFGLGDRHLASQYNAHITTQTLLKWSMKGGGSQNVHICLWMTPCNNFFYCELSKG